MYYILILDKIVHVRAIHILRNIINFKLQMQTPRTNGIKEIG